MRKQTIIIFSTIGIVAAVGLLFVFMHGRGVGLLQSVEKPVYWDYINELLLNTGLEAHQASKNDYSYYRVENEARELSGFIFSGTGEGWGGPIELLVKTDVAGTIKQVYVWEHSETPLYVHGLDEFLATFRENQAHRKLVWNENIHGLAGATITAEAIIAAVGEIGSTAKAMGIFE